jgi:hypothetical protein
MVHPLIKYGRNLFGFVHAGTKNCVSIEALSKFLITLHIQAIDIEQIYGYIQRVSQIDM